MKRLIIKRIIISFLWILGFVSAAAQGNQVDFSTIPKNGTILIYAHHDDDLIWMLPFWNITEKFIAGAMPSTPSFDAIYHDQQAYLNNNGYNIDYESNWITPWSPISDDEYTQYYWGENPDYSYLKLDHLEARLSDNRTPLSTDEINKIKAKLEQYIASPDVSRIITHDNWGEYGHQHHVDLNKAVRQLAVKYRKDVWMLGCSTRYFVDVPVPSDITYTYGNYNTPELFDAIRNIYKYYGRWSWYDDAVTGNKRYIKIVDDGNDKSNLLTGDEITTPGPYQSEPGAYIFDGEDDYLTLQGNNNPSFTIAMWIKPDQIHAMDISKMAEYPSSGTYDRNFYLNGDGKVSARIFDGGSKIVTSTSTLTAGNWAHIVMTSNGSNLKIYINGVPENTISAGTARTGYSTPEFVLGQTAETASFFNGQINDVRLFNYVLSDNEIAELCGMGLYIVSSAGTGGTISPNGTRQFNQGDSQTYTIAANVGSNLSDVKVDHVSVGPVSTYTFNNITVSHTISATFTPVTYTITSSAGSGGSISPSGEITVNHGTNRTYTISTNTGYQISDVKVDDVSVGSVSSYTFNNITDNHTISVTFTPITYIIASSAGSGGTISPSGPITVNHGTNKSFVISADAGYQISDVKVDNISIGSVSSYTFNNITSNHNISATFSLITYTITSSAGSGGTINPSGATVKNPGTDQTYSITANTGYQISNVKVDNVSVGSVSTYTFSNITANHSISATFAPITYTITSSAGSGGTISPSGTTTVNYGTNRTYTISANTGYQISDVKVDNVSVGGVSTYTFTNITSNHTISVAFTAIPTFTITANAGTGGAINPSGIVTVYQGTNNTFTITVNAGYRISDVLVDNVSVGAIASYTFNNVIVNHTISAIFALIPTYSITATAGSGGSINPAGTIIVNEGVNRTFTINPNTGYQVSDVKVDNVSVGSISTYTFNNITANHSISATFTLITYTITSSAGSGGTISPSGTITVNYGTNRTFTISANSDYQISDVKVDNVSVGSVSSYTFNNITANHSISATFSLITYTITSSAGSGGTINPSGATVKNPGTAQTYNITANTGYQISDVKVDNVSVGSVSTYTFNNITANHSISATFTPITYTITSSAGSGGTVSPSGTITVNQGSNRTFTISANTGYQITDVKVDNISVGSVSTYTFNNITTNHSISATFTLITYTITSSAGSGGSISPAGTITVNRGTNQTYTITADDGYQISDVKVDNVSVGRLSTYTFNNITASHTISVTFKLITYTIISSAGSHGTISPSGTTIVNYGTDTTYTITANTGYQISDVKVDNVSMGSNPAYTFINITANHNISVTFKPITSYTIVSEAGSGGTISLSGTITVYPGSNQIFTITANDGFQIFDVKVDDVSMGSISTYTFNNITANHTISVIFVPITYIITNNAGSGGTISPSDTITVNHGSNQTYTITANTGYQIADVQVDNISVGNVSTYTFDNITANHSISATFTILTYTIVSNSDSSGMISPSGTITIDYGTDQVFTITPDDGYKISDVKVDSTSKGAISSYSFDNVTANHTISATFAPVNIYMITVISGTGGFISPEESVILQEGISQTFSITANDGFRINDVFVDNISVGTVSSYTFNHVTADHTISAIFSTDLEVNIHPNPFKDEIIIKIESPEDDHYGISILDMSEKTVYTLAKISGNIEIPINLHELAPGIYILKLYCKGNRIKTFRLLKY